MQKLREFDASLKVVLGDETMGEYSAIKTYNPKIIFLGYDQHDLKKDLEQKIASGGLPNIQLIQLKPHKPELYKSSKMA